MFNLYQRITGAVIALLFLTSHDAFAAVTPKAPAAKSKVALTDLLGGVPSTPVSAKTTPVVQGAALLAAASTTASSGSGAQAFSKTLSVDPRSGSAAVAVPLYIPEGRGGVSPSLGLAYAPTNGNGLFGWGMAMDMESVVRSTKNGTPNYDATDTFLVSLGGKNFELVSLGGNEYRSKYDDDRVRFFLNANVWSAKDKSGTTYYFGSRAGSNVTDGGTKIFRWKLDRIEDLFGNVLVVDYAADNSFEVRYGLMAGKNTTTDVNVKTNFAYVINAVAQTTDRPDVYVDYKPGFAVSEKRLIASLSITGGGNLLKKYNFTYGTSVKTGKSILKNVVEVGADGVTTQTVINLQYNDTAVTTYAVNSIVDAQLGDNLWNCQVTSTLNASNTYKSPMYTQNIGNDHGVQWNINSKGNINVFAQAGVNAIECNTNVFVKTSKIVKIPISYTGANTFMAATPFITLNNAWQMSYAPNISLNQGYNSIKFLVLGFVLPLELANASFLLNTDLADQVDLMNSAQAIYPQLTADFNGDGKTDVATLFADTGILKVALSNGTGFLPKTAWISGFAVGKQLILGDFNGDGRTDIAAYDSAAGTVRVATSDGTKFVDSGIWLSGIAAGSTVLTGDFNGGGLTDLYITSQDASGWLIKVARSTGTGFLMGTSYRPTLGALTGTPMPADINGDGMTDLVAFNKATGTWSVHLNTNGFNAVGSYSVVGFGTNMAPVVADMNQDGRADIGYYDAANKKVVYRSSINGGFGAAQTKTFSFSLIDPATTQIQAADFNGDGLMDFMTFDSMGRSDLAISGGTKFQDLVSSYDNGFGGKLSIAYGSSSDYANTYLPFALPVVQSVTATNNLGDVFTTSYGYAGGYFNPTEREMYGFKETRVIDADGNYALSQFNQTSLYMRGRPDRTATYGADGKLYQESKYQWNINPVITGRTDVQFVSPKRVDNFIYDTAVATSTGVRTATETTYDIALGVPTEVRDYGEVDWTTGADTKADYIRTVLTYGSNAASYLYGLITSKIAYDSAGKILSKTYAYYDGSAVSGTITKGLVTQNSIWNKIGAVESLVSSYNTYNAYGQLSTSKDPLSNVTSITYDATWSMFPLTTTNAAGFVKTNEYYGVNGVALPGGLWGSLKSATDPNAQKMTFTYDAFGRTLSEINPLDSAAFPTTTYEYQTKVNYRIFVTHRRIEHGAAATLNSYAYVDGLGKTLAAKTPSATVGTYVVSGHTSVNSRGLVTKSYPPYFSTSSYAVLELPVITWPGVVYDYDAMGRRIKTTFPDNSYTTSSFTPTTSTSIDPNGHKAVQQADARGRIIRVEEWSGADGRSSAYPAQAFALYAATTYAYDVMGNLLSVTDAKGNVTTMTYDALGRKLMMNDPDMHAVSYQYDVMGGLVKQTDAKRIPFAFTYDVLDRVLSKARADTGADSVTYTYDTAATFGKGRLAKATYGSGNAVFNYDNIGEEIFSSKLVGASTYSVNRTYDALGRIKTIAYPDGKGTVVYSYNAAGRLNSILLKVTAGTTTITKKIITGIVYTANGSVQKITYGNGAVAAYVYDPLTLRLQTHVVTNASSVAVQYFAYTYDAVGNILLVQDSVKNTSKAYTYDALSRMISSNDGTGVIAYQYDMIGNIMNKGNLAYVYGENGAGPHAVTSISDGSVMTYDANGNMATYKTATKTQYYTYDSTNRLVNVQAMDAGAALKYAVADFAYDGDGGRTTKTAYTKSGATLTMASTAYVGDLYEESAGIKTDYLFLGSLRVAAYNGTKIRWFIGDHLGSASTVLDETSAVKEKIEYTPWGEVKSYDNFGNTAEVAWLYFTGKKTDSETGLIYFGARYYNPKLGRFITPDTIVQSPYNPQTLNRYSYCNNNPINLVDPTGHSWKKFWTSAVSTFVQVAATIVLTPFIGPIAAGAVGGFLGGALNAGLNGASFKQAMISGAIGAGIGALGGAAFGSTGTNGFLGSWGPGVGVGLLVAGGAYAAATGNLDSFAGGVVGGVGGWATGTRISTGKWPGSSPNTVRQSPAEQTNKVQKSLSTDQQYELTTNYDIEGQPVSFNLMPTAKESDIFVIGRQPDTAVAKNWPGHFVLDLPKEQWSPSVNDAVMGAAIKNKVTFYTASPQTATNVKTTIYGRELQQIRSSGKYEEVEQYFLPKDSK